MKHLFILFALVLSQCKSHPLPAGQIVKYRVSSKYFNRLNGTSDAAAAAENSNSLYNLLSQIHYSKAPATTTQTTIEEVTTITNDNKNNDDNNDGDVTTTDNIVLSNESPESFTDAADVTTEEDEQQQISTNNAIEINDNLVADDATTMKTSADELIEKVVDDELKVTTDAVQEEAIISSDDVTTANTEQIDEKIDESNKVSIEENQENKVPDSLLSAVGDLLSSVLGISFANLENDDSEEFVTDGNNDSENDLHLLSTTEAIPEYQEEQQSVATEEDTVMSSNADDEMATAAAVDDGDHNLTSEIAPAPVNEVDLKIENLANVETSFMTENTPEVYTERAIDTVKEEEEKISSNNDDDDEDKIVLETLSELTTINDDDDGDDGEETKKPVSIEESVNHVMNLVRGTEGKLALEAAQNIVDSVLIDQHMDDSVSDLDQIVYGTLKEIESNLGLNDADKNLPNTADSFDPIDHEREEMIKNFEMDINESLRKVNPDEDYETLDLEPNPVKAAMYYKFQYGDDF